eukprot:NODE_53_length_2375_cov_513.805172.p1 GENE.NODE_53_length_2375_cov_513.805172~~NODE_53_length_2375_cov_513.805172.p1  ORF type:complete len:589 (-),score=338.42 NODE_53_length_2375_cov_513.805172:224-1990(-)
MGGLNANIEEFTGRVAKNEADLKAATEVRSQERADFVAEEKNALGIINALERAISILDREASQNKFAGVQVQNAAGLTQALGAMVEASMLPAADAAQLTALVQGEQEEAGAPDAANYKTHGGSILDVLEDLLNKAKTQLKEGRDKETTGQHNFKMLEQSLNDAINFNRRDLKEAKGSLTQAQGAKAAAKSDLEMTKKELNNMLEASASLKHECVTKAEDYAAEKASREEELKALAHATKAIAEMTGGAGTLSYGLGQLSFAQRAREGLGMDVSLAHFEVVRFVRRLARQQDSQALTQLARRIASTLREDAAGADPFAKVKGLITDLISRLAHDATMEASHKAYCDTETAHTMEKKENAEMWDNRLTNKIEKMTADMTTLKEQVAELQKSLADLAKVQLDMDKIRSMEHEQFLKDKQEMELGIEGVKVALKALREYYNSENKAHDAAAGSGSGVIGMLEVIEGDFAKGFGELMSTETTAQDDYERGTQENQVEKTSKDQDVKYKMKTITELTLALVEEGSNHQGIKSELAALNEYKAKLDEMCLPKAETYAQRKAKRDAEIAGLKEALSILEGEAALLQRGTIVRAHRA